MRSMLNNAWDNYVYIMAVNGKLLVYTNIHYFFNKISAGTLDMCTFEGLTLVLVCMIYLLQSHQELVISECYLGH